MIQLDQRQLGKSGIVVPALGVGVWSWGDKNIWGYGKSYTRADVTQAYRACLDAGLNFFDTAEIYGEGESERILGECVREDGRPVIIASKFAPLPTRFSASKLLDALDATFQRLGVPSIDLYQIHWPYTFLNKIALMDMMAKDEHIIPIPGAKNSHQATDNAGAISWRLSEEEFRQIDEASRGL